MASEETERPTWAKWFIRIELAVGVTIASALLLAVLGMLTALVGDATAVALGYESLFLDGETGLSLAWVYRVALGVVVVAVGVVLQVLHEIAHGNLDVHASDGGAENGE
jgi:hypothetical protein